MRPFALCHLQQTLTLLGDLKHGRTVHSLARLCARLAKPPTMQLIAPEALKMPEAVTDARAAANVPTKTGTSLLEALPTSDVLYVTRVQKERFANPDDYAAVAGSYVLNAKAMTSAKEDAIVLHPLPRVDEISTDVDADPRAKYFEQMENGMYVRMALLALVLGADLNDL